MTSQKLEIISQSSQFKEEYSHNGVQKKVHVVIKNHPFVIIVSFPNLPKITILAKLFYDFNDSNEEKKEVDFIKVPPMDYRVHADAGKATVEVKLKALTSQHEGVLFRVLLQINSADSEQTQLFSEPIRVISKLGQISKQKSKESKLSRKRKSSTFEPSIVEPQLPLEDELEKVSFEKEFIEIFQKLLEQYNKIPTEERAQKVRKIVNTSELIKQNLPEFLNIFAGDADAALNQGYHPSLPQKACGDMSNEEHFVTSFYQELFSPDLNAMNLPNLSVSY